MIYLLTAIGLTPGSSSTVHTYEQTTHRTTQLTNWEECGPCPISASYTLTSEKKAQKNLSQGSRRIKNIKSHNTTTGVRSLPLQYR